MSLTLSNTSSQPEVKALLTQLYLHAEGLELIKSGEVFRTGREIGIRVYEPNTENSALDLLKEASLTALGMVWHEPTMRWQAPLIVVMKKVEELAQKLKLVAQEAKQYSSTREHINAIKYHLSEMAEQMQPLAKILNIKSKIFEDFRTFAHPRQLQISTQDQIQQAPKEPTDPVQELFLSFNGAFLKEMSAYPRLRNPDSIRNLVKLTLSYELSNVSEFEGNCIALIKFNRRSFAFEEELTRVVGTDMIATPEGSEACIKCIETVCRTDEFKKGFEAYLEALKPSPSQERAPSSSILSPRSILRTNHSFSVQLSSARSTQSLDRSFNYARRAAIHPNSPANVLQRSAEDDQS